MGREAKKVIVDAKSEPIKIQQRSEDAGGLLRPDASR